MMISMVLFALICTVCLIAAMVMASVILHKLTLRPVSHTMLFVMWLPLWVSFALAGATVISLWSHT